MDRGVYVSDYMECLDIYHDSCAVDSSSVTILR